MPDYEDIDPAELVARQRDGELWQLLDVREPWEVEIASVAGAITIPMSALPSRLGELEPGNPLAVLCHSGGRSARVAGWLAQQGFARIANVAGGIDAWSQQVDDNVPRY